MDNFGAWKYEVGDMEQLFIQGFKVVACLLFLKIEQAVQGQVG